jgi:hypothetical protein
MVEQNKLMFNHSAKHRKQQLSIQPKSHLNIQLNLCSTIQLNTGTEWLNISLFVCSAELLVVWLAVVDCLADWVTVCLTKHTFNHSAKQSTTAKHTDNKSAEHTNKLMFNHSTKHRKQQLNIQPTTQLNIQIN